MLSIRSLALATLFLMDLALSGYGKALDEKIILGFEDAELAKAGSQSIRNDTAVWTIPSYAVSTNPFEAPITWTCLKDQMGHPSSVYATTLLATGFESEFSSEYYPDFGRNWKQGPVYARFIFNTASLRYSGFLAKQDWSGFDKFRVDLFSTKDAVIWIYLEDKTISPPVSGRFMVKAGNWTTLEIDLKEAAARRGLDLSAITNILLGGHADDTARIMLDNIRVSKADARSLHPMARSAVAPEADRREQPASMQAGSFSKPIHSPLKTVTGPLSIRISDQPIMNLAPCGWINVYDNDRILLAFLGSKGRLMAIQTLDGGKHWTGLSRAPASTPIGIVNPDHGTGRGQAVGLSGMNLIFSSVGCGGWGALTPRQRAFRITPHGDSGWMADPEPRLLDSDIRHCASNASVALLAGNRIWASWGHLGRELTMGVHAKYSDDQGVTWRGFEPGRAPAVPGSFDSLPTVNTYRYKQTALFAYGQKTGVAWVDAKGLHVSLFDGRTWNALPSPRLLPPDNPESGLRPSLSAVAAGAHLFIAAAHIKGVLHWDGAAWRHELEGARDGGLLSLSQNTVMLITPGPVLAGPEKEQWVASEIFYHERSPRGEWSGPRSLTGGPVDLLVYRGIYSVSVPALAPPRFVPVAFSGRAGEGVSLYKIPNSHYQE